eukprot:5643783-Prymnesium_polylepis.2
MGRNFALLFVRVHVFHFAPALHHAMLCVVCAARRRRRQAGTRAAQGGGETMKLPDAYGHWPRASGRLKVPG